MNISQLLKRHVPVVALIVWVLLSLVIDVPWTPRRSTEEEQTYHTVLFLSDGYKRKKSIAYETVLLDSIGPLQRREHVLVYLIPSYDTVKHKPYKSGDIVVGKMRLENGRAAMPQWKSALVTRLEGKNIPLTYGKITYFSLRCRNSIETLFERYFNDISSLALIEALLLGDKRILSPDQRKAFADAGAMHVLAVSGLHVGIVRDVLMFVLTFGGLLFIPWEKKRLRIAHRIFVICGVWGYAFLTGLSVSVMRSALMFTFLPLGRHHIDSPLKYNRLAAAALVILVINPKALFSPGFLLSFSAVLAIMYYIPKWNRLLLDFTSGYRRGRRRMFWRVGDWLREGLLVSFAAQIGVLPWTLLFFGQMSNYFALTNLVVIPLTWLIIVVSLAALLLAVLPLPTVVQAAAMRCSEILASFMNDYVTWIQQLPGATSFFTFNGTLAALLITDILFFTAFGRLYIEHRKAAWVMYACAVVTSVALLASYASLVM